MKKFTISTISLAVLTAFALPVFAETWQTATYIDVDKVVKDGKIEIANVGLPWETINVHIVGGTLKISDNNGNASIDGRVTLTGEASKLIATNEEAIRNLTVGSLQLEKGADLTLGGNLTFNPTAKPYYLKVSEGSDLVISGDISGCLSATANYGRLEAHSIDVTNVFTMMKGSTTKLTGNTFKAGSIGNSGTLYLLGDDVEIASTNANAKYFSNNGTVDAKGNLTFKDGVRNREDHSNGVVSLKVGGVLTSTFIRNRGSLSAKKIVADRLENEYIDGTEQQKEDFYTKATEGIEISGEITNTARLEAPIITSKKFTQKKDGETKAQILQVSEALNVSGGTLDVGQLTAKKFDTGKDAVVSFDRITITSDNPDDTNSHSGWLKSGTQDLVYDAKFQLNGKLTNKEGEALDRFVVNGVSVLQKDSEILTKEYEAFGLNNQSSNSIGKITIKKRADGSAGYLWNTSGAQLEVNELTVETNISNKGLNTKLTVNDSLTVGAMSNGKDASLVLKGNGVIDNFENFANVDLIGTNLVVGQVTGKLDDQDQETDIRGQFNLENSVLTVKNEAETKQSNLGTVNSKNSQVVLHSGKTTIDSLTSANTKIYFANLQNTQGVFIANKEGDLSLVASAVSNDQYANAQDTAKALVNAVNVGEDSAKDKNTVVVEAGGVNNSLTGTVVIDEEGNWTLSNVRETKNDKLEAFSSVTALSAFTLRHEMNSLSKRMGELRDAPAGVGAWVRGYGSEMEYGSQHVTEKNNSIQVGSDYTVGDWKVGAAFTYTDGESSYENGSAENKGYGLAVYGTWFIPCGAYVDLMAKYNRLDNDFALNGMNGSYDANAYGVSAETGYRFNFMDGGVYVEPQVGIAYSRMTGESFTASNGVTIEQDDYDSLIGRVGVRTGFKFPKDKGTIYARISGVYDFQGEVNGTATKEVARNTIEEDLGGAWLEMGVGANFNWTKNTYTYIDFERTNGGEVKENYRWNVGVRHTF